MELQVQSLIKTIEEPWQQRTARLQQELAATQRLLQLERARCARLHARLGAQLSAVVAHRASPHARRADVCNGVAKCHWAVFVLWCHACFCVKQWLMNKQGKPAPDTAADASTTDYIIWKGGDGDVGSTAAAALAKAMSRAWRMESKSSRQDKLSAKATPLSQLSATVQASGVLAPRQPFQVVAKVGVKQGLQSMHLLSDPTVRDRIRRLTSIQTNGSSRDLSAMSAHPASLSGQSAPLAVPTKPPGCSPDDLSPDSHSGSLLLGRPSQPIAIAQARGSGADRATSPAFSAAARSCVSVERSSWLASGASAAAAPPGPLSAAAAAVGAREVPDYACLADDPLMGHSHSQVRLRWGAGGRPRNIMIVSKPTAGVMATFVSTILHAFELNMAVVVEPKAFDLLVSQLSLISDPRSPPVTRSRSPWEAEEAASLQAAEAAAEDVPLDPTQGLAAMCTAHSEPLLLMPERAGCEAAAAAAVPSGAPDCGGERPEAAPAMRQRSVGGPVLSLTELAPTDTCRWTSLIQKHGRVEAKCGVEVEASEMVAAVRKSLAASLSALALAVGADEGSVKEGLTPLQYLRKVCVEGHIQHCFGGRLVTWRSDEVADTEPQARCPAQVAECLDLVATVGGDGTLLWACKMLGTASVPPIVPFAMGSLGFLTPFARCTVERVLQKVYYGDVQMVLRHRLECTVLRAPADRAGSGSPQPSREGEEVERHLVLNDVSMHRGLSPFLTSLEVYCDNTFVTNVQGDGLLLATPTGSTAYSLAAGGSMVHPAVPGILFTPICPHSLSFRPLLFPDHVQLRVQVPECVRITEFRCSFDGSHHISLHPGDALVVRLCKHPVPTVADANVSHDWFQAVREGLNWNLRNMQGGLDSAARSPEPSGGGGAGVSDKCAGG